MDPLLTAGMVGATPHYEVISMSKNPFEIFKDEDDYVSWDKYDQQLDLIELTSADRVRARKGIMYLRELLGEGFLQIAREQGNPIYHWFFTNFAPGARREMASFAEALESLEGAGKFGDLVTRIKDFRRAEEALTVLDAAYKFLSVGFTINFDPVVMVADRSGVMQPKMPDLQLTNEETGEDIYVEVSRLRTSAKQNLTSRTTGVISRVVLTAMSMDPGVWEDLTKPKNVLPYVRVERALDEGELRDIAGKVVEVIRDVIANKEYREVSVEGTMEMAVSPSHDHSRAKEWAAARKMRIFVEGPRIPFNEIHRAKGKIFDELHQLPDNRPGIVLIPAAPGNIMFFVHDVREIVLELANEVSRHPKLLCAVVSHSFSHSGEAEQFVAALGRHVICSRGRGDMSTEQAVLIHNDACAMPVTSSSSAKIRDAFTN